jgi:hypothetical protein
MSPAIRRSKFYTVAMLRCGFGGHTKTELKAHEAFGF